MRRLPVKPPHKIVEDKAVEKKSAYQRHLRRLSVILFALHGVEILALLLFYDWTGTEQSWDEGLGLVIECLMAFTAGGSAMLSVKYPKWNRWLAIFTALIFFTLAFFMTGGAKENIDDLIDLSLFLVGMVLYLQILEVSQDRAWRKTLKAKPLSLDLRLGGSGDCFDALVMGPHLEINREITDAVDHFLGTAEHAAPLQLYVHCAETLSPMVRETMEEALRAHYEDEELKVDRFLEQRFGRAMGLILISIMALQLVKYYSGGQSTAIVWTIISNFAAFSLWQIGSTFFEGSEARHRLLKILTARNAELHFQ